MWSELALSALGGFCAKLADDFADRSIPIPSIAAALCALVYGAALGLLSVFTPLSALFIALAVANILSSKINHWVHLLGLSAFTLVLLILPISTLDPWLFCLFLALGILDELDLKSKSWGWLSENRLMVPAAALFASFYTGEWLFLVAIAAFDLSYRAAGALGPRLK